MEEFIPKWHRELEIFRKIKPTLIMEGNVLDNYLYPIDGSIEKGSIVRLTDYLHYYFKDIGYQNIVFYDSIRGFYNHSEEGYIESFARLVDVAIDNNAVRAEFKGKVGSAPTLIRTAMTQNEEPTVVVLDFSSRYITDSANLDQSETDGYTILLQTSLDAKEVPTEITDENGNPARVILKNLTIMLVNKINDVPAWFYLDNPNVKAITLQTPTKEEREQLIKGENFPTFFRGDIYEEDIALFEGKEEELEKIQNKFVGMTEGFTFTELNGLRRLCKNQEIRINDMCDVIDLYKFGVKDNPWKKIDYREFGDAYADFEKRVKGQRFALTKTLDVVKRAITGMSDITSSAHGKPKGVLFFAGPTGVGKTETAKTLAEKIFGDERSCVRFDMSEYAQSHSDQKLLGAPPGYVGYEAGGQLTNAIKNNPFCILLFDEIEKANPTILDKFLQILEDGRMTDGKGETVYFSETIIIFTSNLGIYGINDATGRREQVVSSEMPYEDVQDRVRRGIDDYFKLQLGRPEILNRIGENVVVFDFIRPEVAEQILNGQISKIVRNLKLNKNIDLEIMPAAMEVLKAKAMGNLDNGGRGIGNIVESIFVNPLSRVMFDNGVFDNAKIVMKSIDGENMPYECVCEFEKYSIEQLEEQSCKEGTADTDNTTDESNESNE